jgi:hypothetical protein
LAEAVRKELNVFKAFNRYAPFKSFKTSEDPL